MAPEVSLWLPLSNPASSFAVYGQSGMKLIKEAQELHQPQETLSLAAGIMWVM